MRELGYAGTIEGRVFAFLSARVGGVEISDVCKAMRGLHELSVRSAIKRLAKDGRIGFVPVSRRGALYFVFRDAESPIDRRGRAKGNTIG